MSVICLCLLDVQTEAATSGGHVPGDPRQVECAMLQHMCSELFEFQEGAQALWLPGARAVDVVHRGLVQSEQGLGMKRSRTVPYAGIGIIGTKGHELF